MTGVYYAVMGILLILGILLYRSGQTKPKTLLYLLFSLFLLAGVSGVRYEVGDDYYNYMHMFDTVQDLPVTECFSYQKEPGFFLLIKLVALFTNHFQWFYGFIAVLTTFLILLFVYRESRLPFLSVYLYITMLFYYWSLSLIRQLLAASVCTLAIRYIRLRRFLPYFLLVAVAASIHNSALIMLPLYLIAQIPFHYKSFLVVFAILLAGYIAAPSILTFITRYIYQGYSPDSLYGQSSALIYGIFPSLVFAVVWCFKGRLLRQSPDNNVTINFMMYAALFSLFIARVYIVERLAVYFFLPAISLIPNMLCTLLPSEQELSEYNMAREKIRLLNGTQKQNKSKLLKEQLVRIKDAKVLFGFAVGCTIFIALLYHLFAFSQGFYHVQDYQTVFDKHPTERFSLARAQYSQYLSEIGYPIS